MELKKYVVVMEFGSSPELWTKQQYDKYIGKALRLGACPAVKIITHFDGSENLLLDETGQASPDGADLSKIKKAVNAAIKELPEDDDYDPGAVVMNVRESLYEILALLKNDK